MGSDKIRYLVYLNGRWRWRPTATMRKRGFRLLTLSRGIQIGAINRPTSDDKARAIALNAEWDRLRIEDQANAPKVYPVGSVGDGYTRSIKLREEERAARGVVWTTEQASRDDWPRAWRWIEPIYGDVDPRTIQPEEMLRFRQKVNDKVSATEAHRVIKVWRALWKKMARMGYCAVDRDPSLAFANSMPDGRKDVWADEDVKRLVAAAIDHGYHGLAACIAVAWDSQLSPIDARGLTPSQRRRDSVGTYFEVDRAKTGRAAAATLSSWAESILEGYLSAEPYQTLPNAPIFRTRHIKPTAKGGRTWLPRPYTKDKLGKDFAAIRSAVFGESESRQLADMRRSGTVEAFAGGAAPAAVSTKMANTLAASNRLQKVYNPVHVATVRQVDQAREAGRAAIKMERSPIKSVTDIEGGVSQTKVKNLNQRKISSDTKDVSGGSDGARTRDLRRDRPAL